MDSSVDIMKSSFVRLFCDVVFFSLSHLLLCLLLHIFRDVFLFFFLYLNWLKQIVTWTVDIDCVIHILIFCIPCQKIELEV